MIILYDLTFQIQIWNPNFINLFYNTKYTHVVKQKCGGPAPPGHTCKRHFPCPFSTSTYFKQDEFHYIYRCTKLADQWVVPYHAPILLIWNAHMNIQYVTSRSLGKYLTKYVVKTEPSYIFNITEGNTYKEHIIA